MRIANQFPFMIPPRLLCLVHFNEGMMALLKRIWLVGTSRPSFENNLYGEFDEQTKNRVPADFFGSLLMDVDSGVECFRCRIGSTQRRSIAGEEDKGAKNDNQKSDFYGGCGDVGCVSNIFHCVAVYF
jgi:hypothetical protein